MLLLMLSLLAAAQSEPRPTAPMAAWVTDGDYPIEAIRGEQEGVVHFRLDIDERGIPVKCAVTTSSGHPPLDAATCQIMQSRTRFHPATDAAGRAIPSSYASRIRWILPDEPASANLLEMFKPALLKIRLDISPDGRITSCTPYVQGQPSPILDELNCGGLTPEEPRRMPQKYGPTYRALTHVVTVSVDDERYPIDVGASEVVLMRRTMELALDGEGTAVSCRVTAATGTMDVTPFDCDRPGSADADPAPAHRIIVDFAVIGTPR